MATPRSAGLPFIAEESYYSRWLSVTQDQIDSFAALTGDKQWIHQLEAECSGSPFNAPIAHGLLLVSFAISMARESGALQNATWVLYGFDKLRFRAPVKTGTRIRCRTIVRGVRELFGRTLLNARFVMEIEDHTIPAFVADCLLLNLGPNSELRPEPSIRNSAE